MHYLLLPKHETAENKHLHSDSLMGFDPPQEGWHKAGQEHHQNSILSSLKAHTTDAEAPHSGALGGLKAQAIAVL